MNAIDPLQLQRLIDGELDPSDVQELLRQAGGSPNQWEEIATGFVENQLWSQAVCTHAEPSAQPLPVPQDSGHTVEAKKNDSSDSETSGLGISWLAIAASMMLAAILGYGVKQIQDSGYGNANQRNSIVESTPIEKLAPLSPVNPETQLAKNDQQQDSGFTKANYHLEFPTDNEELNSLVGDPGEPLPLFNAKNQKQWQEINERRIKSSTLPPEFIKRFTGSGYQMEKEIKLISGRLGDGRTFIVPVETIRFISNQ